MISPCLCNVYLHRLDRQWTERGAGELVRFADDVVVMCRSRQEAEHALVALREILSELGLTLKDAKTRIVELREGGEGLDFLGFHHRWVRGTTPASKHLCFLARWPSRQAMQRARGRIHELTDRRRLRLPVEEVVQDLNMFLRGWAGVLPLRKLRCRLRQDHVPRVRAPGRFHRQASQAQCPVWLVGDPSVARTGWG